MSIDAGMRPPSSRQCGAPLFLSPAKKRRANVFVLPPIFLDDRQTVEIGATAPASFLYHKEYPKRVSRLSLAKKEDSRQLPLFYLWTDYHTYTCSKVCGVFAIPTSSRCGDQIIVHPCDVALGHTTRRSLLCRSHRGSQRAAYIIIIVFGRNLLQFRIQTLPRRPPRVDLPKVVVTRS